MKDTYNAFYVINIVFQAIFTLLWQIGLALLIGYLAVDLLSAPKWIYAPLIAVGAITGFYSMIKFILSAMRSIERIEKERKERQKNGEQEK